MKTQPFPLNVNLDSAFEQTPAYFSKKVANALADMKTARPARKSRHRLALAAAILILLCGSALAAGSLGVLDFLIHITAPEDIAVVKKNVSKPLNQVCEGEQVIVQARDYLWNGMTFSMAMHVAPAEPAKYRLIGRGDIGADGIHTDDIWWDGEITTMDKWLPKGKQALVIDVTHMNIGGEEMPCGVGWLPEELGETFLLEVGLPHMTPERYAKLLDGHGNIKVSVTVESWLYGSKTREQAVLRMTVEAPTQEDWRKLYYVE